MRNINLTEYECKVIRDLLVSYHLCKTNCYCDYDVGICNTTDENGNYKCEMQAALQSIKDKLEV